MINNRSIRDRETLFPTQAGPVSAPNDATLVALGPPSRMKDTIFLRYD
jgi:hypothetical protein